MSSRRLSSRSSASKPTDDDEINELVLKLQSLLPLLNQRHNSTVTEATTILEETCSYIKRLRREVDSLSERLSQLMVTADITHVELIGRLLQH